MKQNYNDLVKRIQAFSLTCDIKDENGVVHHFHNGHEYVEIGGMKWATMNVGATAVTDYGLYFQWGDSSGYTAAQVGRAAGQKTFDWEDYKWTNDGGTTVTKYNSIDSKTILDAEDDGVAVNWGDKWGMPTTAEFVALGAAVNTTWTNDYKSTRVKGLVCTAKDGSGAELFFPAAGLCINGRVYDVGSSGLYWSSSLFSIIVQQADYLYFSGSGYMNWQYKDFRLYGYTLRGVVSE